THTHTRTHTRTHTHTHTKEDRNVYRPSQRHTTPWTHTTLFLSRTKCTQHDMENTHHNTETHHAHTHTMTPLTPIMHTQLRFRCHFCGLMVPPRGFQPGAFGLVIPLGPNRANWCLRRYEGERQG